MSAIVYGIFNLNLGNNSQTQPPIQNIKDNSDVQIINNTDEQIQEQEEQASEPQTNDSNEEIIPVNYIGLYPDKVDDMIEDGTQFTIIDVSAKYDDGHLINSINYPVDDGTFESKMSTLNKDSTYLIYGRTDIEAKKASQLLVNAGFQKVYYIKGSYGFWLQSGYDYEK